MDQLPRLGKRELICLLSFTCNYVVFVWRGFLFLWVLGMGYVILLWHSLSLPYNYFSSPLLSQSEIIIQKQTGAELHSRDTFLGRFSAFCPSHATICSSGRFLKWPHLSFNFPYYWAENCYGRNGNRPKWFWAENVQMTSDAFIFNYPPVLARVLTQNGRLKNKDAIFVCLNFYATVRCKKALSERQLQGMPWSAARRFFETYGCVGKRCKTFRSVPLMQRTPEEKISCVFDDN